MTPTLIHTSKPIEIAALHREALATLGREYTLAEIIERWSSVPDTAFIVASLDGPTGFISYQRTAPAGCYISDLFISPAYRGRGYARLLIGALKARDLAYVFEDIKGVVQAAGQTPVKVILETSKLDDEEKIAVCALSKAAGAAFVSRRLGGFGVSA